MASRQALRVALAIMRLLESLADIADEKHVDTERNVTPLPRAADGSWSVGSGVFSELPDLRERATAVKVPTG